MAWVTFQASRLDASIRTREAALQQLVRTRRALHDACMRENQMTQRIKLLEAEMSSVESERRRMAAQLRTSSAVGDQEQRELQSQYAEKVASLKGQLQGARAQQLAAARLKTLHEQASSRLEAMQAEILRQKQQRVVLQRQLREQLKEKRRSHAEHAKEVGRLQRSAAQGSRQLSDLKHTLQVREAAVSPSPCLSHRVSLTVSLPPCLPHRVSPTVSPSPCLSHCVSFTVSPSPCLPHRVSLTVSLQLSDLKHTLQVREAAVQRKQEEIARLKALRGGSEAAASGGLDGGLSQGAAWLHECILECAAEGSAQAMAETAIDRRAAALAALSEHAGAKVRGSGIGSRFELASRKGGGGGGKRDAAGEAQCAELEAEAAYAAALVEEAQADVARYSGRCDTVATERRWGRHSARDGEGDTVPGDTSPPESPLHPSISCPLVGCVTPPPPSHPPPRTQTTARSGCARASACCDWSPRVAWRWRSRRRQGRRRCTC
jgi:hypothetical protein